MKVHLHRWLRPRFSVRTLAVFVTLVCIYFAAWQATIRGVMRGPVAGMPVSYHGSPPIGVSGPFLCWAESYRTKTAWVNGIKYQDITATRQYYMWLFGHQVKLPFAATRPIPDTLR